MNSRERRLSSWSNATCAMPLCEALPSRRGRGPHHAQIDRVGTWDISGPTAGSAQFNARHRTDKACDIIVMASHGQSGIIGMIVGSVTAKVVAEATIPVLVYH
jgi:Universal stress protein family